jgi:hypothetical protein
MEILFMLKLLYQPTNRSFDYKLMIVINLGAVKHVP